MISRKTVFILGAGASNPYGYPVGSELRRLICQAYPSQLNDLLTGQPVINRDAMSPEVGKALEFVEVFYKSRVRSIDRFLAINDHFSDTGKVAIGINIIRAEKLVQFHFKDELEDHWYFYLYNRMIDGLQSNDARERFGENQVTFVTFNYDRSLEQYLFESLKNSFHKSPEKTIIDQLKKMPIYHVYGKVDDLPWEGGKKHYGSNYDWNDICRVKDNIKLIFERTPAETADIKAAINSAKAIYFLGFGYDEDNMKAIGLPDALHVGQVVFGSYLGSTAKEIEDVKKFLSTPTTVEYRNIRIEDKDCKCVEFLRRNL